MPDAGCTDAQEGKEAKEAIPSPGFDRGIVSRGSSRDSHMRDEMCLNTARIVPPTPTSWTKRVVYTMRSAM